MCKRRGRKATHHGRGGKAGDLEEPGEAGVPVGHMLSRALAGVGQAADDQAQGAQGLVDLDALLELLTHRS